MECEGEASAKDKIRNGAFEKVIGMIDEVGFVNEVEIDLGAELSVGIATSDLTAASATEIPSIVATGPVTNPRVEPRWLFSPDREQKPVL